LILSRIIPDRSSLVPHVSTQVAHSRATCTRPAASYRHWRHSRRSTEDTMIIAAFVMLSSIALYVGMQVGDLVD
jgi:hypothetical protein